MSTGYAVIANGKWRSLELNREIVIKVERPLTPVHRNKVVDSHPNGDSPVK